MHKFTPSQEREIVTQFAILKHATLVRRWFCKQYPEIIHHHVPLAHHFTRVKTRFEKTNSTRPQKPPGPAATKITPEMIETVRGIIEADDSHVHSLN